MKPTTEENKPEPLKQDWRISCKDDRVTVIPKNVNENGSYIIAEFYGPDKGDNACLLKMAPEMRDFIKRFIAEYKNNFDDGAYLLEEAKDILISL